jgi:hypothetical protein
MPRAPVSAAAKVNLMFTAFAFAAAPAGFGSAVACALAGNRLIGCRLIGCRRLALAHGRAVAPPAVLTRVRRGRRQVSAVRLPGGRAAEPGPR